MLGKSASKRSMPACVPGRQNARGGEQQNEYGRRPHSPSLCPTYNLRVHPFNFRGSLFGRDRTYVLCVLSTPSTCRIIFDASVSYRTHTFRSILVSMSIYEVCMWGHQPGSLREREGTAHQNLEAIYFFITQGWKRLLRRIARTISYT